MGGRGRAERGEQVVVLEREDVARGFAEPDFTDELDLTGELVSLGPSTSTNGPRWWSQVGLLVRVVMLSAVVGVVLGGGTLLILAFTGNGLRTNATHTVAAYLTDVRDGNYSKAYGRLCGGPDADNLDAYSARLAQARSRGHGVSAFRIKVSFTTENLSLSATKGTVTFADGAVQSVSYDLQKAHAAGGPKCIVAHDDLTN